MSRLTTALTSTSFFLLVISLVMADIDSTGISRFSPEKKSSDAGLSSDFMSAMNGATRLRYGKRSGVNYNDLVAAAQFEGLSPQQQAYALRMPRWATVKRMASYNDLSGLVDQINGSERLRFGRK